MNTIISNTPPQVGRGATVILYNTRQAYEVLSVNEDCTCCVIDRYVPTKQEEYEYTTLKNTPLHLVLKNNKWYVKQIEIAFDPKIESQLKHKNIDEILDEDELFAVYENSMLPINVVEGITRVKHTLTPINIVFGVKKEYYNSNL